MDYYYSSSSTLESPSYEPQYSDDVNTNYQFGQSISSLASALTSTDSNETHISNKNFNESDMNNLMILNITQQQPIEYAMIMFGYVMPFLLIITIIANTLIVLVLSQKSMITPTNLVLLSMAIADLLTLLFPAPWYFYMYTFGNHDKSLYPIGLCYCYYFMSEVIPAFFHTASIWLTLLLAAQRYIYICHPILAKTWCTIPRMIRATILIFILALSSQITRFFDRKFVPILIDIGSSNELQHLTSEGPQLTSEPHSFWACQVLTSSWVSLIGENIYFPFYYGFRILFVNIGPCVALIILNDLLFRALREAQRKRDKLFNKNKHHISSSSSTQDQSSHQNQNLNQQRKSLSLESKKQRDSNSTTIMLIVVVSVFLLVEIPLAVATSLHVMAALELIYVNYDYLNMCILFTNFFIVLSYPLNFAIYCGMSKQFRETFTQLFMSKFTINGNRQTNSTTFSSVSTAANL